MSSRTYKIEPLETAKDSFLPRKWTFSKGSDKGAWGKGEHVPTTTHRDANPSVVSLGLLQWMQVKTTTLHGRGTSEMLRRVHDGQTAEVYWQPACRLQNFAL